MFIKISKKLKYYLAKLGPGFITGASDDDPSGIATYSQTGAYFGFQQLWTALFSFPFMVVVQEMCGRIGLVTGRGLAGVIRRNFPKQILYLTVYLLLFANTINIGADLGAMAASARLIYDIPFAVWLIIITAVCLILQIFVSYKVYARILKYLSFTLLAYVVAAFAVKADWSRALSSSVVPSFTFDKEYLLNIVAILGTTISPYLFFWQAGEEVEEEIVKGELKSMGAGIPKFSNRDIKDLRFDTFAGMFFSNLIMFFIILTTASTLNKFGISDIQTADQAALALQPIAGNFAFLLFATGVIGTGLLAVPVLAGSASYALSEAFGWSEGLYQKFTKAHGFYGVITFATLIGLLVNFSSITPFKMLYYSAVINGICAPPLLILIMLISNNTKIMGKFVNGKISNIFGWLIVVIMSFNAIALLITFI